MAAEVKLEKRSGVGRAGPVSGRAAGQLVCRSGGGAIFAPVKRAWWRFTNETPVAGVVFNTERKETAGLNESSRFPGVCVERRGVHVCAGVLIE